jgi:hypothetical protein
MKTAYALFVAKPVSSPVPTDQKNHFAPSTRLT